MKKNGNAISVQLGAVPRDPNLGSIGILFRQKKKNRCQKVGRPLKPRRRPSCPATRPSHSRTSGRLIIISIRLKSIEIGPRYGWLPPYSTEAAHTHTHTHPICFRISDSIRIEAAGDIRRGREMLSRLHPQSCRPSRTALRDFLFCFVCVWACAFGRTRHLFISFPYFLNFISVIQVSGLSEAGQTRGTTE